MKNKWCRALVGALVSSVAACSPYSYSTESSKMSDSVNALSTAYSASFDAITANRAATFRADVEKERALGRTPQINVAPECQSIRVSEDGDKHPCCQANDAIIECVRCRERVSAWCDAVGSLSHADLPEICRARVSRALQESFA